MFFSKRLLSGDVTLRTADRYLTVTRELFSTNAALFRTCEFLIYHIFRCICLQSFFLRMAFRTKLYAKRWQIPRRFVIFAKAFASIKIISTFDAKIFIYFTLAKSTIAAISHFFSGYLK